MVQPVASLSFSVAQNAADLGYIARFDHESEEKEVVFVPPEAPFPKYRYHCFSKECVVLR